MFAKVKGAREDQNYMPFRFALKAYIEDERLKIPVLPDVVSKVIALINHPNADANTLARLIHKDQALAGYVLRVSNSPIFAGTREITTLRQAIARIGAKTLGKIALSITMQGTVFKAQGFEEEIKAIWRETLTSGTFAQDIGRIIGETSESLYLCGLLHTVGKPVILQALQELQKEMSMELTKPASMSLVEEFHRRVGYKVAEQWKLPDAVKDACIYYSNPEDGEEHKKEVRITYLAHEIAQFVDRDPTEQDIDMLVNSPAALSLRITAKHFELLIKRLEKVKQLLESMSLV